MRDSVSVGTRVTIPFGRGNRRMSGFVIGISDTPLWPVEKMKELLTVEEKELPVEGQLIKLAAFRKLRQGGNWINAG